MSKAVVIGLEWSAISTSHSSDTTIWEFSQRLGCVTNCENKASNGKVKFKFKPNLICDAQILSNTEQMHNSSTMELLVNIANV